MHPNPLLTSSRPSIGSRSSSTSRSHSSDHQAERELPPVTDWDHFSAWCRQNHRQALPASDETLTLYFRERRSQVSRDSRSLLGALALVCAILGVLAPALGLLFTHWTNGDLPMGLVTSGLFFAALQIIALGCAWPSRETTVGRAAATISALSLLLGTALILLVVQMGGLEAVESWLRTTPTPDAR